MRLYFDIYFKGDLLAAGRLESCLTQKQPAENAGVKQNMISDY